MVCILFNICVYPYTKILFFLFCFHTSGVTQTPATNISDIIDVIIEKEEEESKHKQSAVQPPKSVAPVIGKEEYGYGSGATVTPALGIVIDNGIFEYKLQAPYDVLFAAHVLIIVILVVI